QGNGGPHLDTGLACFDQPSRRDLGMRTHLVQVEDRLAARVQGRQLPLPLDTRAGREDLLERHVDRAIVRELQVDQVWPLERGTPTRAPRIATAGWSPPPPMSATWTDSGTGGPSRSPLSPSAPAVAM